MAFPSGVTTSTLSVGPFINAEGETLQVTLTVTPVFGSSVDFITWNATGVVMSNAPVTGTVQGDGSSQVVVPVVDQSGWIDPSAAAYTMWRYVVSWTVSGKTASKNVQPLVGQPTIDVDKIASGAVGTPVSTPLAVVTDIGGLTGHITVEDLVGLGIGAGASDWATLTGKPAFIGAGASAAAARTAISAGTSDLVIGTTGSTAKAGDYQPTAADISDATIIGKNVLTAADAAGVRTAIGAGTSSLAIGTTGSTAKVGNYTPSIADLPAGDVLFTTTTTRPTSRTDVIVLFLGSDPGSAALDNDLWLQP